MPLMFEKKPRSQDRKKKALDKAANWREVCRIVGKRDQWKCRACHRGAQPYNPVDPHHIKFRSAGGGDTTRNVALICRACHDDIHAYRLAVVGDNANKPLTFVRRQD